MKVTVLILYRPYSFTAYTAHFQRLCRVAINKTRHQVGLGYIILRPISIFIESFSQIHFIVEQTAAETDRKSVV